MGRSPYPVKLTLNDIALKLNYNEEIFWPTDFEISKEAKEFIQNCLKLNANNRASLEELLQYPFFTKNKIP